MLTFNDYNYIGKHGTFEMKDKYRFSQEKANQLLANKQYLELADYLSQYQFKDAQKDAEFNNRILQLRDEGRKAQAYYKNIPEGEENTVDFTNSVFSPGGLKALRCKTINNAAGEPVLKYKTDKEFRDANPDAAAYIDDLDALGSTNDRKATAIKLEFNDKKSLFGLDFLKKDENDYYTMLSNAGLTEKELEARGGRIRKVEGKVIVEFDKNADCCTRVLNGIPRRYFTENQVKITGLDNKGEITDSNLPEYALPYSSTNEIGYTRQARDVAIVNHMNSLVDVAKNRTTQIEHKANVDTQIYSAEVFDIKTDRTDVLDELYNSGQMSWQEYNTRMKEEKGVNVRSRLAALSYGDYEIYTDYFNDKNDEASSEIRHKLKPEDWDKFKNILKGVPASKIHYLGETSGGRVGLHISIDPDALYEHKGKRGSGTYTNKPIQIFIPGFLTEEIESQMNNDTGLRAVKEWNNMIDYQYKHESIDGTQIGVDENGIVYRYVGDQIYMDNSADAKERAIRDINEDLIKEEASRLKYRYMNERGEINKAGYEQAVKQISIKAVQELFRDIPFEDLEGNNYYKGPTQETIDALFNPELRERVYLHPEDFQYQVLEKLRHLYELYDYMSIDLIRGNSVYSKN